MVCLSVTWGSLAVRLVDCFIVVMACTTCWSNDGEVCARNVCCMWTARCLLMVDVLTLMCSLWVHVCLSLVYMNRFLVVLETCVIMVGCVLDSRMVRLMTDCAKYFCSVDVRLAGADVGRNVYCPGEEEYCWLMLPFVG